MPSFLLSVLKFFDRLELFREESIKKQEELIGRVRREVRQGLRGRFGYKIRSGWVREVRHGLEGGKTSAIIIIGE